jgi:hypothetical protein
MMEPDPVGRTRQQCLPKPTPSTCVAAPFLRSTREGALQNGCVRADVADIASVLKTTRSPPQLRFAIQGATDQQRVHADCRPRQARHPAEFRLRQARHPAEFILTRSTRPECSCAARIPRACQSATPWIARNPSRLRTKDS